MKVKLSELRALVKNALNEGYNEQTYYMFFQNIKQIKRQCEEILSMDRNKVDHILKSGHDWAADHISTSKDDVEEVYNFLKSKCESKRNDIDQSGFMNEKRLKSFSKRTTIKENVDKITNNVLNGLSNLLLQIDNLSDDEYNFYDKVYQLFDKIRKNGNYKPFENELVKILKEIDSTYMYDSDYIDDSYVEDEFSKVKSAANDVHDTIKYKLTGNESKF
jgi:hypothetical protein